MDNSTHTLQYLFHTDTEPLFSLYVCVISPGFLTVKYFNATVGDLKLAHIIYVLALLLSVVKDKIAVRLYSIP